MSEDKMDVEQPQEEAVQGEAVQEPPLNRDTAIQKALKIALTRGSVVKGLSEVLKALEAQKAKVIFLADDCDNDQYKSTLNALAKQFKVPVLGVESWEKLKDFCRLGLLSSTIRDIAQKKSKEAKIKPRCSSCAILDWGEESDAKEFLEKEFKK